MSLLRSAVSLFVAILVFTVGTILDISPLLANR